MSFLDNLASLDDGEEFVNILYYGPGGTGKTTAAAFAAEGGKVLVVNAEGGAKAKALARLGIPTSNIRPFPQGNVPVTFEGLDALYWAIKADLEANPGSWFAIVWDSITEISKKLLEDAVALSVGVARQSGKERDEFFIDRADYGRMTEQLRLLVRRFRDLPTHFVMTALERTDKDDTSGQLMRGPALSPALQGDLVGYVDLVCATSVVGEDHYGTFRPSANRIAKDRYGLVPPVMVNPTFNRVFGYIEGTITTATDPEIQRIIAAQSGASPAADPSTAQA